MKKLRQILILFLAVAAAACHEVPSYDNDVYGNFDALWTVVDEHYCFFGDKDIDWNEVGERYRAKLRPDMKEPELFEVCAAMLDELRDGHTNLISWFTVSYYRNWWSDYPQNFDWRLVQERYLDFDYSSGSGFAYKLLEDSNVGYVRCSTFATGFSDSFIYYMLMSMKDADGLIIDLRDNGGGELSNVERLAAHFIDQPITAGYIRHKTGPGHDDFSEPYEIRYEPSANVKWLKPVVLLTNRSTFSAANEFVAVMDGLEHVTQVGDVTGGGCRAPFSSSLPVGWSVRFSAVPIYDRNMQLTEYGISPEPANRLDTDPSTGRDAILDHAIALLRRPEK